MRENFCVVGHSLSQEREREREGKRGKEKERKKERERKRREREKEKREKEKREKEKREKEKREKEKREKEKRRERKRRQGERERPEKSHSILSGRSIDRSFNGPVLTGPERDFCSRSLCTGSRECSSSPFYFASSNFFSFFQVSGRKKKMLNAVSFFLQGLKLCGVLKRKKPW